MEIWTGVEIRSSPAVADDGTVYFGCRDRRLYALKPDGKAKVGVQDRGMDRRVASSGRRRGDIFRLLGQELLRVNSNGSKKWSFQTSGVITSSAAVGLDGVVYFGSYDGRFYALKPDGSKKWEYRTGGPIVSSPALSREDWLCFTRRMVFFML